MKNNFEEDTLEILTALTTQLAELKKNNMNPHYKELRDLILDNNTTITEVVNKLEQNIQKIDNHFNFLDSRIESLENKTEPVQYDIEPIKQDIEHIKQVGNQSNDFFRAELSRHIETIKQQEERTTERIENLETRLQALINILTKIHGDKLGSGIKGEEYKITQQTHKELKELKTSKVFEI